ncbi:thioesterase family protein, partial [Mesorhizobium sp. M0619]
TACGPLARFWPTQWRGGVTGAPANPAWLCGADIDFNLHLNNARYMMLADLAHDPENRNRFSKRIMRQIKMLQRPWLVQ